MFRALDWLLDTIAPVVPRQDPRDREEAWVPAAADRLAMGESPLDMMLAKARHASEMAAGK